MMDDFQSAVVGSTVDNKDLEAVSRIRLSIDRFEGALNVSDLVPYRKDERDERAGLNGVGHWRA